MFHHSIPRTVNSETKNGFSAEGGNGGKVDKTLPVTVSMVGLNESRMLDATEGFVEILEIGIGKSRRRLGNGGRERAEGYVLILFAFDEGAGLPEMFDTSGLGHLLCQQGVCEGGMKFVILPPLKVLEGGGILGLCAGTHRLRRFFLWHCSVFLLMSFHGQGAVYQKRGIPSRQDTP